jgi:hypothetical protein
MLRFAVMNRTRISTTVDTTRLRAARQLLPVPGRDRELLDQALALLIEHLEAERERAALPAHPYDDDPDLKLPEPPADTAADLPYEGEVPPEAVRLARQRRRQRR